MTLTTENSLTDFAAGAESAPSAAQRSWRTIGRELLTHTIFMAPVVGAVVGTHAVEPGTASESLAAGAAYVLTSTAVAIHRRRISS